MNEKLKNILKNPIQKLQKYLKNSNLKIKKIILQGKNLTVQIIQN